MPLLRDLPYGPVPRHVGDLHLPEPRSAGTPPSAPVLLIHGGGWNSLSKESLDPVARLAVAEGRAVFNINYRLLDHAPWPACLDDCVAAARFLLAEGLAAHGLPAPADGKLLVVGASAGGHLAMLAGLALGARACSRIVSLAGPSRVAPGPDDTTASAIRVPGFLASFFGSPATSTTPEQFASASPAALVTAEAPPLRCIHSRNDHLVPPAHSLEAVAAWRAVGVPARCDFFDGPDRLHGFWAAGTPGDLASRQLVPPVADLLRQALRAL